MAVSDEWISARDALALLQERGINSDASVTICRRAHIGLVKARARRFSDIHGDRDDCEVPAEFWWAKGHAALEQNWQAGDFSTWIRRGPVEWPANAFGVIFCKADIEEIAPPVTRKTNLSTPAKTQGGRPRAEWWEDLLINIAYQIHVGDLKPKKQADVERAMATWLAAHEHEAADSSVRERARKLWTLFSQVEN